MTNRQLFFQYLGLTSKEPLALEIEYSKGIYLFDKNKKAYIDLLSGFSVNNIGHQNNEVITAIKEQAQKYTHLTVYGEYIQSPQVKYAEFLLSLLPNSLNSIYFVNSGSEAVEGAMKLAKRFTGRNEFIAFKNAYHGSTQGALSLMNNESFTQAFRPLLPGIKFINFNDLSQIEDITHQTAAVIIEVIQAEGGIISAEKEYLKILRNKCNETGALLIVDEIQTGFARTGKLFAFQHYDIIPDIITIAKSMGAGMPIGALIANKTMLNAFTNNPVLGHITTFGGHPVSAAAALAGLKFIIKNNLVNESERKAEIFKEKLKLCDKIKSIRGKGLFLSCELNDNEQVNNFIKQGLLNGFITDNFLFDKKRFRIAPPLTITEEEINLTTDLILKTLNEIE